MTAVRDLVASLRRAVEGPDGPPLAWTLRGYHAGQLSGDVLSGLTVAALIVPLAIGYAGVAGLPPEVGLYASLAPLIAYAVFGSARRLIVGPDASTAALIGATIAPLAAASDERVRLAGVLGLLVAALFVAMRLGRMGFLADFLSRPILVGYMTGVGLTVAAGQIEKILGGPAIADGLGVLSRVEWVSSDIGAVVDALVIAVRGSGAELISAALGVGVVVAMLIGRKVIPRFPMALVAMIVALVLSAALDLQSEGVPVLGPVPAGLPSVGIPVASISELFALLPGAVGLALLSFADTSVTGRTFAGKAGERTDADRELVALAAADAAGAVTGGYPVSSSPSRTSAAEESGSTSQMTGVVAAFAVALVLVLLTGPLAYLPVPALGGVILVSALGLIDIRSMRGIWRVRSSEGLIAFIAMGGVIVYGTLVGVAIAVLLAALNIVRRAAWPLVVEEGRLPDGTWRDLVRREDAARVVGVAVIRFTGPLFFANATALEARIREIVAARPETKLVILDFGATADVDLTAADTLRTAAHDLVRDGRRLAVALPLGHVRDELRAYGLADLMAPTAGTFGSIDMAIVGAGLDPAMTVEVSSESAVEIMGPPKKSTAARLDEALPGSPTNRLAFIVLAVGTVVVLGAVVAALFIDSRGTGPTEEPTAVPNLVGLPIERATSAAADAGFELSDPVYVSRPDQPEDTVVGQEPPAGTIADPGSVILPLVSTGRQIVIVPDVVGLAEGEAIASLTGAGLTVRRAEPVSDDTVPTGVVVSTAPAAGTSVATGTSVAYTVSLGAAPGPSP